MNISTLEYFVSAAELLNFTKAAKKHYIAQTAISQQIAKLEQEIGVELFVRKKNRVELTDTGHIFYNDVKSILNEYANAVNKAQVSYNMQKKVLTIGYTHPSEIYPITDLILEFQEKEPNVEIIVKEGSITGILNEIHQGLCDLFINMSCTFDELDTKNLEQYCIYSGEMLLGVSKKHPKANYDSIDAIELKEEKFIVLNAENTNVGIKKMHEHCRADGYELNVSSYVGSTDALMLMVELNCGVGFFQDIVRPGLTNKVKFLPIKNSAHRYHMNIIWNPDVRNVALHSFIAQLKETVQKKTLFKKQDPIY